MVLILLLTKDEFGIEPRYAHTKKLKQIRGKNLIFETGHPRALKFEKFLFFGAF